MQLRLALALLLSFLVLVYCGGDPKETDATEPGGQAEAPVPDAGEDTPVDLPEDLQAVEHWRGDVAIGPWRATFDNRGAVLAELRLDGYYTELFTSDEAKQDPTSWVPLVEEVDTGAGILASMALLAEPSSLKWTHLEPGRAHWRVVNLDELSDGVADEVHFELDGGRGVVFEKIFRVGEGQYDLDFEFVIKNAGTEEFTARTGQFLMTPAMGVPALADDSFYTEPTAGVCWRKSKTSYDVEREERKYSKRLDKNFPPKEDIVWAGVDNKYFAVLLRPAEPEANAAITGAKYRTVWDAEWARANPEDATGESYRHITTDLYLDTRLPEAGKESRYGFRLYAGPKDRATMTEHAQGEALSMLVDKDLGFFKSIASVLLWILGIFHGLVGNWGVSIILLTLTVRLALFPFNRRSQVAMARHATKMKRIQPRLNESKERNAKDPRKQREEQARIMQEEGAFPPLGGCLPIFVQIPVFFGLFKALRISFDLRQAPFAGWIHDLSMPDRFLRIDLQLPLIGTIEYLNVLPPLMVVLWILQQRVMPKPTDPQALKMQRMMMWMPILFGFFLYHYAAGLSLYMITTSLFGILEQTVIKQIWPLDDSEKPKKKGGFMDKLAKMQEQAKQLEEMKKTARSQQDRQRKKRDGGGGGGGKGKGSGGGKGKRK